MHRIAAIWCLLGCECAVPLDELPVEGQHRGLAVLSRLVGRQCARQHHHLPPAQLDAWNRQTDIMVCVACGECCEWVCTWLAHQQAEGSRIARGDGHPDGRTNIAGSSTSPTRIGVGPSLDEGLHDGELEIGRLPQRHADGSGTAVLGCP